MRKRQRILSTFLLPSIIGVSIFVFIPFVRMTRESFHTTITDQFVGFQNYESILHNEAFQLALSNTVRFILICLPILIAFSLFIAVQLNRMKDIQLIKSLFLLPLAVPAATIVIVWKMLFSKAGIVNSLVLTLGGTQVDFMNSQYAFWVLVGSYVWKNLGYTIVLWLVGLRGISSVILEAASVDGASERQCFFHIVLPNLKNMLYTITVLSFLNSFKVFREVYLVSGSYPHESIYLLQHLFNNWFVALDLDKMSAAAVIIAIVLFGGNLFLQHLWDKKD